MNIKLSLVMAMLAALLLVSCGQQTAKNTEASATVPTKQKTIVVTYAVLGSVVQDLVGDDCKVVVLMPNGQDPHEWEPSAQDIAQLTKADLVVKNGIGLEGGMEKALAQTVKAGVPVFVAGEHIKIRTVKVGQGLPGDDPDQAAGAQDPHLWLDPQAIKHVVAALSDELKARFNVDVATRATDLENRLEALDTELKAQITKLPAERRLLVTGHESLGYFAEHFGFTLVGAIVPGLTDQAEVSASELAALRKTIQGRKVSVIFTELGTPPKVAKSLASDLGIQAVDIGTHALPADGSYFTMLRNLVRVVVASLGAKP